MVLQLYLSGGPRKAQILPDVTVTSPHKFTELYA